VTTDNATTDNATTDNATTDGGPVTRVEPKIEHRVRFSGKARVIHAAARLLARPAFALWPMTPRALRVALLLDVVAARRGAPVGTRVRRLDLGGFPAELVRADGVEAQETVVLYFHGGGFVIGGLGTHRRCVSALSRTARRPVLSVAYRQYPATDLDGSVEDGLTAYRWLLQRDFTPGNIVFAGDSAGGYLAFAVALRAREAGLPAPAGIVAISPLLDWDVEVRNAHPNLALDAYLPGRRLAALHRLLVGTPDPIQSPVNHDLRNLPPVLIQVAETEVLRCDAEAITPLLAAAGVPCTLQIWAGQIHAFPVLAGLLPEATAALIEAGAFIQQLTTDQRNGPDA
jgi:acetyl esterase/lipase